MIVVVALAGLAVVIAVVVLAAGMGGELADSHPDHPPLPDNRPVAGTDAALLRLPMGLWGYHVRVTDEALRWLAYALTERDTRIAILEQQAAELRQKLGTGERAEPGTPAEPETPWASPAQALELESRRNRYPPVDRHVPADQADAGDSSADGMADDDTSGARRQWRQ